MCVCFFRGSFHFVGTICQINDSKQNKRIKLAGTVIGMRASATAMITLL